MKKTSTLLFLALCCGFVAFSHPGTVNTHLIFNHLNEDPDTVVIYEKVAMIDTNFTYVTIENNDTVYLFDTLFIGVPCTVGTAEYNATLKDISLAPNPTSSKINFSEKCDVEVFNEAGNLLFEKKDQSEIDLKNYSKGVYLVRINTKQCEKVIKH